MSVCDLISNRSLIRMHQLRRKVLLDVVFLFGLLIVFAVQLINGADVLVQPRNPSAVDTIASMVVICFLIGIGRSWELIGGPSIGITREVTAIVRDRAHGGKNSREDAKDPREDAKDPREEESQL